MEDSESMPLIAKLYRELTFVYAVSAVVGFMLATGLLSSGAWWWSAAVWIASAAIAGIAVWTGRLSKKFSNQITKGNTP